MTEYPASLQDPWPTGLVRRCLACDVRKERNEAHCVEPLRGAYSACNPVRLIHGRMGLQAYRGCIFLLDEIDERTMQIKTRRDVVYDQRLPTGHRRSAPVNVEVCASR